LDLGEGRGRKGETGAERIGDRKREEKRTEKEGGEGEGEGGEFSTPSSFY